MQAFVGVGFNGLFPTVHLGYNVSTDIVNSYENRVDIDVVKTALLFAGGVLKSITKVPKMIPAFTW